MPRLPEGWTIRNGALVRITTRECSVLEFMARLSEEEQVALGVLRLPQTDAPATLKATLNLLAETRDNTTNKRIRFDDPRTQRGVDITLGVLAALPEGTPGRIAPEDVPARKAAWLADWPQPGEGDL